MKDEIVKAIITMVSNGGVEAASVAKLYIWLNSSVFSAVLFVLSIVLFYFCASAIVGRIWDANKDLDR